MTVARHGHECRLPESLGPPASRGVSTPIPARSVGDSRPRGAEPTKERRRRARSDELGDDEARRVRWTDAGEGVGRCSRQGDRRMRSVKLETAQPRSRTGTARAAVVFSTRRFPSIIAEQSTARVRRARLPDHRRACRQSLFVSDRPTTDVHGRAGWKGRDQFQLVSVSIGLV
jgi:hypothetical protein